MEYFLIEFSATEYNKHLATFQKLVKAFNYADAIIRIGTTECIDYDCKTACNFKNLTIQ